MKVSENFSRHEFECNCGCGFNAVDIELVSVLEKVRSYFNRKYGKASIEITSGCRCRKHNNEIQKYYNLNYKENSLKSKHLFGIAADFKVWKIWHKEQISAEEVYNYLNNLYPNKYGIGKYRNRTHFDVRNEKARWVG